MIVQANFLNHWKTKALGNAIGEIAAIRALLFLWAHCQERRAWEFELNPAKLAGICDFHGDEAAVAHFWTSMQRIGWLDVTAELGWFQVHQWGEVNISLIAKWAGAMRLKAHEYPPRGASPITKPPSLPPSKTPANDQSIDQAIGLDVIGEDRSGLDGRGENSEACVPGADFSWTLETGWQGVTDAVIAELQAAFPRCEVAREFLAMVQWLKANPDKAHKRNWRRFAVNWIKSEHDRNTPPPPSGLPVLSVVPEKKGKGPPEADFPWRAVAIAHEGWTPEGEWKDQTARTKRTLRESWRNLPPATKAALWARSDGGEKKEGALDRPDGETGR